MHEAECVRTSLEVGFTATKPVPTEFLGHRGKANRVIEAQPEFPFEDKQFEVVMMEASSLSAPAVKEAHRVLRSAGRLYFKVPMKTRKQCGYSMEDVYSLVRHGFDIVQVECPKWWHFWCNRREITICARKKNWRQLNNSFRSLI